MDLQPLSAEEERFVRALARALLAVPRVLEADLARAGVPLSEYFTLMHLSEAPEQRMRMSDLASRSNLSLSGMTRIVDRLQARGLVRRERCESDARGWNAVLTPAGLTRLQEAWPTHLDSVRRRLFERMGDVDLVAFSGALERVAEGAPGGPCPEQ